MSNAFQTDEGGSDGGLGSGGNGGGGLGRQDRRDVPVNSFAVKPRQSRLRYPFDQVAAKMGNQSGFSVTSNAKMSSDQFAVATRKLLIAAGLDQAPPALQLTFMEALYVAHAINSSSVLNPDRAEIKLEGVKGAISYYANVIVPLGDDARRYFRVAADEIYVTVKELLDKGPIATPIETDMIVLIHNVAFEKGLSRFPHCAFDAADACSPAVMTMTERMAVSASKAAVVSSTPNVADSHVAAKLQQVAAQSGAAAGRMPTTNKNSLPVGGFSV